MNCINCGSVLRLDNKHPRTKLCDTCYQAKRKSDVNKNIKNLREKISAMKPKKVKTDDQTLNLIINKLIDKGYKVLDAKIDEKSINILVDGEVVINLPEQWKSNFDADNNTTEISYNFDLKTEVKKEITDPKIIEYITNHFVCTRKKELLNII